ncbi:tetratricopeptide repeat protein [bacterium]|nr:tetratricopeptide repeat protein [bacterium]
MKKYKLILLIICIILNINSIYALEGSIQHTKVYIDYSLLNEQELLNSGKYYKDLAESTKDNAEMQRKYYSLALGYYITASEVNYNNPYTLSSVGQIYGKYNQYTLGKSYINRSLNLAPDDFLINFNAGEFFYDNKDYFLALKHFKKAETINYQDKSELYIKLGKLYEKLGDLANAKTVYQKVLEHNYNPDLDLKIRSIEDLNYNR